MKVMLINSDIGYGSTGRITKELYESIMSQGNDAIVGYGRECTDRNIPSIKIGNRFDVYSHALKTRLFDFQGFGSIHATKKFIKKCKDYKPDIIHLHNIHGSYINVKLLFAYIKDNKIPVIWTLHDCWSYTGHCAHYTFVGCNKWKKGCYHCVQKRIYPSSIMLDHSSQNYIAKKDIFTGVENLTITTVSNWLQQQVRQSYLGGYPIRFIPNGIDLEIFKPTTSNFREKYELKEKIILLGVASIWHDRKGLWLFNELAIRLENSFQIVLVGITKKQNKMLSNNIVTIYRTNNINELPEIYTQADIFINTSIEETFGMVTLEALACGTQVITNTYSANPEIVNEECGIIVDEINTNNYINAIHELIIKPKNKEDCIDRARQYSKKNCYQTFSNLYYEVME